MTGKVKVYQFRTYDPNTDTFIISNRMATRGGIRRIHAEPIKATPLKIDKREVNADGMTEIGFGQRHLPGAPWAILPWC